MRQAIHLEPIGTVENEIKEMVSPNQIRKVPSCIVLDPTLVAGLEGLTAGQNIMILFHFHLASPEYDLLQHPKRDSSRPKRGIFALRSPQRPNGIGVTNVELLKIEGNVLFVRNLDAINGTPVLDIKPA